MISHEKIDASMYYFKRTIHFTELIIYKYTDWCTHAIKMYQSVQA